MEIKNALFHDLSFVVVLLINLCCYLINFSYLYFLPSQLDFTVFEEGYYVLGFTTSTDVWKGALWQIPDHVPLHILRIRNKTHC